MPELLPPTPPLKVPAEPVEGEGEGEAEEPVEGEVEGEAPAEKEEVGEAEDPLEGLAEGGSGDDDGEQGTGGGSTAAPLFADAAASIAPVARRFQG